MTAPLAPAKKKEAPQTSVPTQNKQGQKFDYQFQVAAYKNQQQADAMTAQLKKSGLSVKTEKSMENGKVWYKNIVSFRGTTDDVDLLRKQLKQHKITTLIRKAKKPVTP